MRRDAVEAGDGGDDGAGAHRALGAQRRAVQRGRHQHEPPGRELPRQHGAQQQERADLVPAHERPRAARVADEAGEHLRQPLGRVRVPRPVLGVAVERQVGQHEPEAVAELLHQRLPLAVREAGRVEQRERRPGARLAVGDPRPVGMVVEAELHGAQPIVESGAVLRRSRYDREIVGLAIPALGALAAEPLYVLVDTAIVGHLGTPQLASLAIAATVLSTAFTVFNFLTYGTTAQVARLHGAGEDDEAAHVGAQAQWLSLIVGALLLLAVAALAHPLVVLMGGEGEVADGATTYLRIAALGAPAFMLASAGQGYLRGIGDLTTPLVILVAAHAVNVVLELLFVYGYWGLAGSAWGTVIAQLGWERRSWSCSCGPAGSGRS